MAGQLVDEGADAAEEETAADDIVGGNAGVGLWYGQRISQRVVLERRT